MKKIIFLLLTILSTFNIVKAEDQRFTKANSFYQNGKFEEAKESYLDILKTGVQSSELYYNLGNTYYKTGDLASAILNYERALLLNPNDEDVKNNLDLVNTQIVDKITPIGRFFLFDWIDSLKNSLSTNGWAIWAVLSIFGLIGSALAFLFSENPLFKQIFFYLTLLLLIVNITTTSFSISQKNKLTNREYGIVFTPSVTVKSSPDLTGSDLFILHTGTKIKVLRNLGSWAEIQIQDGTIGWMQQDAFVKI